MSLQRGYESEMGTLREQVQVLSKELGLSEVRLVSAEKEYQYLKSQVDERQAQIEALRREVAQGRTEAELNAGLARTERGEKEKLLARCAQLEEEIRASLAEIERLKRSGDSGLADENKRLHAELRLLTERLRRAEGELEQLRSESFLVKEHGRGESALFREDEQQKGENEILKVGVGLVGSARRLALTVSL